LQWGRLDITLIYETIRGHGQSQFVAKLRVAQNIFLLIFNNEKKEYAAGIISKLLLSTVKLAAVRSFDEHHSLYNTEML
jgi:hypothetical protein